jgi:hypothetical protein
MKSVSKYIFELFRSDFPLQFLNVWGIYPVVRLAVLIEQVGIVQFTYLLVNFVEMLWDKNSNLWSYPLRSLSYSTYMEPEASTKRLSLTPEAEDNVVDNDEIVEKKSYMDSFSPYLVYVKYILSTIISISCFFFIIICLAKGYSSFKGNVLSQFVVIICALTVIFYCEGNFSVFYFPCLVYNLYVFKSFFRKSSVFYLSSSYYLNL